MNSLANSYDKYELVCQTVLAIESDDVQELKRVLTGIDDRPAFFDDDQWGKIMLAVIRHKSVNCFSYLLQKNLYTSNPQYQFEYLCSEYHYANPNDKNLLLLIIKTYVTQSGYDLSSGECFEAPLFSKNAVLSNPDLLLFCVEQGGLIDYKFSTQVAGYKVGLEQYLHAKAILEDKDFFASFLAIKDYNEIVRAKKKLEEVINNQTPLNTDMPAAKVKTKRKI